MSTHDIVPVLDCMYNIDRLLADGYGRPRKAKARCDDPVGWVHDGARWFVVSVHMDIDV